MHLRLIRHGESVANREKRLQGQMDFPLSAEGQRQAQVLGKWLAEEQIDAIYASDLSRAYHTAEEIAKHHHLDVIKRTDLREMYLGRFQGLTLPEVKEKYPEHFKLDWISSGLDDVEQFDQLKSRAEKVIGDLLTKHYGERIVLVSHGAFIGIILMTLLGIEWPKQRVFAIKNTGITTLDFHGKHVLVLGVNESPHLDLQDMDEKQHTEVI